MLFAFEKLLSPCWLNVHSAWNGNTAGFQTSPAAQPRVYSVYSCLWVAVFVTQHHRTTSKLADDAVFPPVVYPGVRQDESKEWKLQHLRLKERCKKKMFNRLQRNRSQHVLVGDLLEVSDGFFSLPHLASLFKKQGQLRHMWPWVEAQTMCALSNLQPSAMATSGFISCEVQWAKDGIMNSSRINVCTCTSSM